MRIILQLGDFVVFCCFLAWIKLLSVNHPVIKFVDFDAA